MAEHYFSLAIQLEPHNGEALGGLGLVNHRVGRLDKAANYLDEALRYSPENQDFRTVLELIRK